MQIANNTGVKKGDLLYRRVNGYLAEFVGMVYISSIGYSLYGIVFHERFGASKEGVIYVYHNLDDFYKAPYMWIDNVPIYEGSVVYGKYNDQKYTVKDGWLILESKDYCKIFCKHINDYSAFTDQAPKKEYWIAFCGELALDKVDTLENVKEFVKEIGYSPESKMMKYIKVDI